mgnify:CR=1 FL=1
MAVEHSPPVSPPVVLVQTWSVEFIEFAVESICEFPVVFPEDFVVVDNPNPSSGSVLGYGSDRGDCGLDVDVSGLPAGNLVGYGVDDNVAGNLVGC